MEKLYDFIDKEQVREDTINLWQTIVNMESYAREAEKINALASFLKSEFEKEGFKCRLIDVGGGNGNSLVGILGEERPGKPIVFSGHMDTVFPSGTFGENPFKILEGKAYGPGALDMKGGIIISLLIVKALNHIGYSERPIKVILSGDEEIGHANSKGAEVFLEEAKGGLCAFNMETGLVDNSLCVGRKGRMGILVEVKGKESHAGNDFTSGINAIEEMAHKILDFQNLTNLDKGTTVTVSLIKGGSVSNAIPGKCEVELDIRFEKMDEMDRIKDSINEICNKSYLAGTTTSFEMVSSMATYETTNDVLRFYDFMEEIGDKYGFEPVKKIVLGGGSDASYVTIAGTPALCSMGVQGQWNHTKEEYALVESIFTRAKFISTAILEINNFA